MTPPPDAGPTRVHGGAGGGVFGGVRVVELATHVYVPTAAAVLASLGADVVKVEHPVHGDPYRSLHTSALGSAQHVKFLHPNRGKRSVGVDITRPEGRAIVLRLVATADVFVTSLRPGALRRAGLDVADVRAANARIVYARGNGLGFRGPDAGRAGYDASAYWARGGVGHTITPPGSDELVPQRPAFGDSQGGMYLAFGIAAALFRRATTGEASVVDGSLLATALWGISSDATAARQPGYDEAQRSRPSAWNPLTSTFRTADGRWLSLILLEPDRYWASFCAHIGRGDLVRDPRFVDMAARNDHADELLSILDREFAGRTLVEWRAALATFEGPWEPVQSVAELSQDVQVLANDYFVAAEDSGTMLVAPPVQFDGVAAPAGRAPELGEHTELLLVEDLGFSWDEVGALRDAGVIA